MKHLQGVFVILFLFWGLGAIVASHAYGETYQDLQQQVQQQRNEMEDIRFQQQLQKENAVFDESERIYMQSEEELFRKEDHPEIYGQP